MGKATVYCEKCGNVISEDDFEKGKAVFFENANYCSKCKKDIEHLLNLPPVEEEKPLTKKPTVKSGSPSSSSALRKAVSAQIPPKQTPATQTHSSKGIPAPKQIRSDTTKYHKKAVERPEQPSGSKTYIYGIIGFIVLIFVVYLLIPKPSKKDKNTPPTDKKPKPTDYRRIVDEFANRFDEVRQKRDANLLALLISDIESKSEEISKTQEYARFQTLLEEAKKLQKELKAESYAVEELDKKLNEQPPKEKCLEYIQYLKDKYPQQQLVEIFNNNYQKITEYETKIKNKISQVETSLIEFELADVDKIFKEDNFNFNKIEEIFEKLGETYTTYEEILNRNENLKKKVQDKKKEIENFWLEVGEKNYSALEESVDKLLSKKDFDSAEKLITAFNSDRKKWCVASVEKKSYDLLQKVFEMKYKKDDSSDMLTPSTDYSEKDFLEMDPGGKIKYSFEENTAILVEESKIDLIGVNERLTFDGLLFFQKILEEEYDVEFEANLDKGYIGVFMRCAVVGGQVKHAGGTLIGKFKNASPYEFEYNQWCTIRASVKNNTWTIKIKDKTIANQPVAGDAPEKGTIVFSVKGGTLKLRNFKIYK